jgi:hypothetical protein
MSNKRMIVDFEVLILKALKQLITLEEFQERIKEMFADVAYEDIIEISEACGFSREELESFEQDD